jgi:hypothetical protein
MAHRGVSRQIATSLGGIDVRPSNGTGKIGSEDQPVIRAHCGDL